MRILVVWLREGARRGDNNPPPLFLLLPPPPRALPPPRVWSRAAAVYVKPADRDEDCDAAKRGRAKPGKTFYLFLIFLISHLSERGWGWRWWWWRWRCFDDSVTTPPPPPSSSSSSPPFLNESSSSSPPPSNYHPSIRATGLSRLVPFRGAWAARGTPVELQVCACGARDGLSTNGKRLTHSRTFLLLQPRTLLLRDASAAPGLHINVINEVFGYFSSSD